MNRQKEAHPRMPSSPVFSSPEAPFKRFSGLWIEIRSDPVTVTIEKQAEPASPISDAYGMWYSALSMRLVKERLGFFKAGRTNDKTQSSSEEKGGAL